MFAETSEIHRGNNLDVNFRIFIEIMAHGLGASAQDVDPGKEKIQTKILTKRKTLRRNYFKPAPTPLWRWLKF